MREIKFRQWDSFRKRMSYGHGQKGDTWIGFPNVSWERYPIMQYTGLKDKNGKEDYKSDLLKIWVYNDNEELEFVGIAEILGWNEYSDLEIIWRTGLKKSKIFGGWELMECYEHEIIGNIYENLDLLK